MAPPRMRPITEGRVLITAEFYSGVIESKEIARKIGAMIRRKRCDKKGRFKREVGGAGKCDYGSEGREFESLRAHFPT